eukprot:CAMPEP_0181135188 /NCGR_PEP_ID=MMETSP1071-20121207/32489_1 /TAXON_ID=35127 /ORGANISM="Thalassiosira sp., Strain NH16" /LENGTH=205 /DNA_ID=CAMNT_0023221759 /DNA_START=329 /DNA_END=943 /DNA_ORIENTATION=+
MPSRPWMALLTYSYLLFIAAHPSSYHDVLPRRWSVNLNLRENDVGYSVLKNKPPPCDMRLVQSFEKEMDQKSSYSVKDDAGITVAENKQAVAIRARKQSKAMSIAVSPGKQIAMNGFMLWMSGKSLNIFSISITTMAIMNPVKGILSVSNAFRSCEDPDGKVDLTSAKALFVLMNLIWLGVGLYKMANMKLLPLTSADWEGYVVW